MCLRLTEIDRLPRFRLLTNYKNLFPRSAVARSRQPFQRSRYRLHDVQLSRFLGVLAGAVVVDEGHTHTPLFVVRVLQCPAPWSEHPMRYTRAESAEQPREDYPTKSYRLLKR